MAPQLCARCVRVSRGITWYQTMWTVFDIILTSLYCPFCAIVWNSIETIFKSEPIADNVERSHEDTITVLEPFGVEGASSSRRSFVYYFAKAGYSIELSIFRTPQEAALVRPIDTILMFLRERIPVRFNIPSSTRSWESISQTKLWLKNCLENHQPVCSPLSGHRALPKRLVRVRKSGPRYNVQLVEPDIDVEYLCLSHRWGTGHARCTTTNDNLVGRKNAILWDELPTLFRHALEFTHNLGMEYLWIDSLCIVQDDKEDWKRESQKMGGIYEGANLTLAASIAKNEDGDMFCAPRKSETGIKVEGLGRYEIIDDIFVRILAPHRLEAFPLLKRAWVYQERLLSSRYLHFSPVELVWECNKTTLCQCSGKDIESERAMGEYNFDRFAKKAFWSHVTWDAEQKAFGIKKHTQGLKWNIVVQGYSSLDITYRKDKLPAISGMAKQFRRLGQNSDYLAGLWKSTFFENLMWHASSRSARMPRSAEWIAPTWSWLSVGAGVTFFGQLWIDLEVSDRTSLLNAVCEPVDDDDTMKLKFASVTICGPSFSATIRLETGSGESVMYILTKDGIEAEKFDVDYDLSASGDFQVNPGSEIICVEIGNVTFYDEDGFGMHGLVLRRLSNGKYERIGVVEWAEDIRSISNISEIATLTII